VPRPSNDPLHRPLPPLPRRHPLFGPFCPACEHPSCRRRHAARLLRLGGHRSEFAREHTRAATLQARHPHLLIWFGESTMSYWVASPVGLIEALDSNTLLLALRSHADAHGFSECVC
jgi:hypothetical protein